MFAKDCDYNGFLVENTMECYKIKTPYSGY